MLIAVAALTLDIVSKVLAVAHLTPGRPVRLLGGAVYLSLTRNTGAAWNLGTGYTAVLAVVAVVVILVIIRFARRLGSVPWAVALGLVLGGAGGNLTDRLFRAPGPLHGGVIDFVSLFDPYGQRWPIFNAADSCLVCGVVLAVLLELTGRRLDGTRVHGRRTDRARPAGPAGAEPTEPGAADPAVAGRDTAGGSDAGGSDAGGSDARGGTDRGVGPTAHASGDDAGRAAGTVDDAGPARGMSGTDAGRPGGRS